MIIHHHWHCVSLLGAWMSMQTALLWDFKCFSSGQFLVSPHRSLHRSVCCFYTAWWSSLFTTHLVNWEAVGWHLRSHSCITYTCYEVWTETDLCGSYTFRCEATGMHSEWISPSVLGSFSFFSRISQILMYEMKLWMLIVSLFKAYSNMITVVTDEAFIGLTGSRCLQAVQHVS